MNIQKQTWYNLTRFLIYTTDGSVQLEIYPYKGYIHSLWVDEYARKVGKGTTLFKAAESIAKEEGCKYITIEWDINDSPTWVLNWYKDMGYKEEFATKDFAVLKKVLE